MWLPWFWLAPMPKTPPAPEPVPVVVLLKPPYVKLWGHDGSYFGVVTKDQALDEAVDQGCDIDVVDPIYPTWRLRGPG